MRSFQLNFEINAMLYDNELTAKIDSDFEKDLTQCMEVDKREFEQRPLSAKIQQSAARLLSPIL